MVILVGAGISTNSGIPDFRTPETGWYSKFWRGYSGTEFSLECFHSDPKPLYDLLRFFFTSADFSPTLTHVFIRLLQEKGILLRCFTQNFDGLERKAGILEEKIVEAHGNLMACRCIRCKKRVLRFYVDVDR